jgi:hypothetical protein
MGLLDLVILGLQMVIQADQERINLAIRGFLIRGSGILLLVLIAVLRNSSFFAASVWTDFLFVIIFLFGFYLRLGILPLYWAYIADPGANRSLGSVLRLAPAGLALILLLRSGPFGLDSGYLALILVLLALPSILAAWTWVRSSDEVAGRSFFITAAAAIGAAAVLLNHPDGGLSWSLTLLLSGGILFLFRARQYWFILLPLIGFWGLTGLPLSPSWPAMKIYSPPANPALVLFILLQASLIAGYLYHTLRLNEGEENLERWEMVLYPAGLALLPSINLLVSWLPWQGSSAIQSIPWWPGFVIAGLGIGMWWLVQRKAVRLPDLSRPFRSVFSLLNQAVFEILGWVGRGIGSVSFLLEGEGGVLWALLFLALMITVLSQIGLAAIGNGN